MENDGFRPSEEQCLALWFLRCALTLLSEYSESLPLECLCGFCSQMTRRAPKVGRQLVVANPLLAAQFSEFNRRADESPMRVEEVMEGSNTHLLWQCSCGNIVLKAPIALLQATQILCKMEGCTAKPQVPRRMRLKKKSSLDSSNGSMDDQSMRHSPGYESPPS